MAGLEYEVWINKGLTERERVMVQVVKSNVKTVKVRLPDGNIIKRKRERDIVM